MESKDILVYWINERQSIHELKDVQQRPGPWTDDPIMRDTYFCNVHREDDKVTKYIRGALNDPDVPNFEWLMCMARLFNWPDTIHLILMHSDPVRAIDNILRNKELYGEKIWGGAYVVTTHGQPISKRDYCVNILSDAYNSRALEKARNAHSLEIAHQHIMELEGFASFMAAQVIADLKNTPGHPLSTAPDWSTFVASGPGSKKGMNYFFHRDPKYPISESAFKSQLEVVGRYVRPRLHPSALPLCNQDLQNCLCEFSKYMRVKGGGRAKRKYPQK